MLKLELQCLVTWLEELTHWKRAWCWKRLKARGEGVTEDETVGKHHWVNGHELAQTPCPCPQRVGHDMTTEQQSCLSSLSGYEGHWPVLTLWTAQQPWIDFRRRQVVEGPWIDFRRRRVAEGQATPSLFLFFCSSVSLASSNTLHSQEAVYLACTSNTLLCSRFFCLASFHFYF